VLKVSKLGKAPSTATGSGRSSPRPVTTSARRVHAYFLEDTGSDQRFEHLCRAVCLAASLDSDRSADYSDTILEEVGQHAGVPGKEN
jgi:hypothetical protein